jgi:HAD superfamily hydrolase (TIGR01509 family)
MIEAIIFDMDGLLVDSEPVWDEARRRLAHEAGQSWNEADHQACMGVSTATWGTYMVRRLNLNMTAEEVQAIIVGKMLEIYATGIPYMPGAVAAVDVAGRHAPLGLASGSHRLLIDAVTRDPAMAGQFRAVVCADEVRAGKPAPDVYLAAAAALGVDSRHCICLEDSGSGILAGKAAGMQVVAVPDPRFAPPENIQQQANLILPSLQAFTGAVIEELAARIETL